MNNEEPDKKRLSNLDTSSWYTKEQIEKFDKQSKKKSRLAKKIGQLQEEIESLKRQMYE